MDTDYEVLTRPELGLLLYAISGFELDKMGIGKGLCMAPLRTKRPSIFFYCHRLQNMIVIKA